MSLFANQLKTLIATMEAVTEKKSFDMTNWYDERGNDAVDCGFAACICGHQAASGESEFFNVDKIGCLSDIAEDIAEALSISCRDVFGNDFLAGAIYSGVDENRTDAAELSKLFTCAELSHPHLTKEKPTIKQAISFIKLCLKKVEAAK